MYVFVYNNKEKEIMLIEVEEKDYKLAIKLDRIIENEFRKNELITSSVNYRDGIPSYIYFKYVDESISVWDIDKDGMINTHLVIIDYVTLYNILNNK